MALFKKIDFGLSGLMDSIAMGQIGLPDIQRPFVWPNTKVRDLFDSMYRGYPVGYLLLWENGASDGARTIGIDRKQTVPQLVVIDGQQRLTSLFAVLRGIAVKRQNFTEEKILIAFRPLDGSFEVTDAAIKKDASWIPDISVLWHPETHIFDFVDGHLSRLSAQKPIAADEKRRIQDNIVRLFSLTNFPFTALQLAASLDEEQVADVFVRVNSKGTPLNQADFILTLMSVFRDDQRAQLEAFCQQARVPSSGKPSPFNHFLEPNPDHLLRVTVGLGFRRARLQHVYSILRGKDLETGEFSTERREQQFGVLEEAQRYTLDLQNWHEFLKCVLQAGFRSGQMVTSRNALLFAYVYFLIGKRDFRIEPYALRNAIARWFFFVALTGRYTSVSPESRMEQDLADLRGVRSAEEFLLRIDQTIAGSFTPDYWSITLPTELATSSARSPALFAYYAALNLLDARAFFSRLKTAELMDPATKAKRSSLERHHLFPKAYLHRLGVRGRRDVNQIANYALTEWKDNDLISDQPPAEYFPAFAKRVAEAEDRERMLFWHALPEGWQTMDYQPFLEERRRRIAAVVRAGFETLQEQEAAQVIPREPVIELPGLAASPTLTTMDRLGELLDSETHGIVGELLDEPRIPVPKLAAEVASYLAKLEVEQDIDDRLDIETAREVADRCTRLLNEADDEADPERLRLIQAAAMYFVLEDDAESDTRSPSGFDDDLAVVAAVETVLAAITRNGVAHS
jgi:hypothetical protein